MKLPVGDS